MRGIAKNQKPHRLGHDQKGREGPPDYPAATHRLLLKSPKNLRRTPALSRLLRRYLQAERYPRPHLIVHLPLMLEMRHLRHARPPLVVTLEISMRQRGTRARCRRL